MAITQFPRPTWYTDEDETAWGRVKAAFRRDWQQTKHDFGAAVPDLNQQVGDTISQASGSKAIPPGNVATPHPAKPQNVPSDSYRDEDEPAYRYGYAAYRHYAVEDTAEGDSWDETQSELQKEWDDKNEFERHQEAIRRGWTYGRLERFRRVPR